MYPEGEGAFSAKPENKVCIVNPSSPSAQPRPAATRVRSSDPLRSTGTGSSGSTIPKPVNEKLKNQECILFLDVDGVLHGVHGQFARHQFTRPQMNILGEILKRTQSKIVLSSSWRINPTSRNAVETVLRTHGLPTFISRTPNFGTFQRAREILAWVNQYTPKTWVAIDDWDLHLEGLEKLRGHFVRTNARTGLTTRDCESVVALFQQQAALKASISPANPEDCDAANIRISL